MHTRSGTETPGQQVDADGAVPFVPSGHSGATFEIDEVEALPDDDAGLLDLHEGASEFIPVERQAHAHAQDADAQDAREQDARDAGSGDPHR